MAIRVSNIRLGLDESEAALPAQLQRILGIPPTASVPWRILRKSLDARDRANLQFVYSVEISPPEDEGRVCALARGACRQGERVERYVEPPFAMPRVGTMPLPERPVVVGSGPG